MYAIIVLTLASTSYDQIQRAQSLVIFSGETRLPLPANQGKWTYILFTTVVIFMVSLRRVFDFTMCNPPFYSSKEDVQRSAEAKEYQPNAVCRQASIFPLADAKHGRCALVQTLR